MEAKTRPATSDLAEQFERLYYAEVDPEEVAARAQSDLKGAAASHLAFGREFSAGKTKVRAYNPVRDQHGWQSTHTESCWAPGGCPGWTCLSESMPICEQH